MQGGNQPFPEQQLKQLINYNEIQNGNRKTTYLVECKFCFSALKAVQSVQFHVDLF